MQKTQLLFQRTLIFFFIVILSTDLSSQEATDNPVRIGVVGLVHTHVHWILGREASDDLEIVGIVEPNRELAKRYSQQHGYSMDIVFDTMEEMIAKTQPEAVTAFNTIYDHLEVVKVCAPKGIHIMVEKPLAVSLDHAKQMADLARKHKVMLLTNYETTWYATNHKLYEWVHNEQKLGDIRKMVVHDGHRGPAEIGVNKEFLEWLIDPKWNGAGALTDFGCYGANLMTWMMQGEAPLTVTAITQTMKPERNPLVDDEATIILTYPKAQGIIQASWNWHISRKDMEIYGKNSAAVAKNRSEMTLRLSDNDPLEAYTLEERKAPLNDPFSYFAAMIRGQLQYDANSLSSLENNMVVMRILDAAMRSAEKGKTVKLKD